MEIGTWAIQNEEKPKTGGELGADAFRAKQEYEALEAQKADGAHLIFLVHQRDGFTDKRDRLGDQLVKQVIDVDDLFRLDRVQILEHG